MQDIRKIRIFAEVNKVNRMCRLLFILISLLIFSGSIFAESDMPIIEMKADRTTIYPQRMELTGEETLMDILQMVPDLMIAGYEDVISKYNLRIDNCPINGDTRLILFCFLVIYYIFLTLIFIGLFFY